MTCRNCGAEIADKALICYRCGTATTEAKHKPAALPPASRGSFTATVLAIVLLGAVGFFLVRTEGAETSRVVTWVAVAAAVLIVALRAYARRR